MAAVERLVEALGGHRQRAVGFRGARRLPVEGAAEQHEHAERHREEGGDLRDVVASSLAAGRCAAGRRPACRDSGSRPRRWRQGVLPSASLVSCMSALVLARRQEPRRRQDLEQRSPAQRIVPRQHRADHAARVGEQEHAASRGRSGSGTAVSMSSCSGARGVLSAPMPAPSDTLSRRAAICRMENGQAVVLDDVRAAADRQLQDERRPEGGEEECDQDGDEVAKRTLRNGDARPAWRGDGKPELSFLEEKFAELRFCHRVPLTPGKLCSWSLFLIATPFTDEESLQLFEFESGVPCPVFGRLAGGMSRAALAAPTWSPANHAIERVTIS